MGRKLMCTCGCAQLLGGCDHVGCPNRGEENELLRSGIASNQTDQQIFDSFVVRYGAVVLAAPTTHGFDLLAWIAPFAVFAAASLGTILLVRRWSIGKTQTAQSNTPMDDAERERRDQIRRETGDGGF
jgi:cytochrome c-type biogenesis protein CcmH